MPFPPDLPLVKNLIPRPDGTESPELPKAKATLRVEADRFLRADPAPLSGFAFGCEDLKGQPELRAKKTSFPTIDIHTHQVLNEQNLKPEMPNRLQKHGCEIIF